MEEAGGVIEKKKLSRQRRWQIKKHTAGLCIICGKKAEGTYCQKHKQYQRVLKREAMRKRLGCVRRNLGAKSYRLEKETKP